ncbi:MAG: hypothetical protein WKF84_17890 [Pyrinomonadaceae bacterium]
MRGVWSPNLRHAEEAAALARSLRVGEAQAFTSIEEMVASPEIGAFGFAARITRIDNMRAIVDALRTGKGSLVGMAFAKKPLARNVREAKRMVELVGAGCFMVIWKIDSTRPA